MPAADILSLCIILSQTICKWYFLHSKIIPFNQFHFLRKGLTEKRPLSNSCSTTNKMHLLSHIIYSCKTLYMFRTVFPSTTRNSILRIQQRYMSNSCCYLLLSGIRWNSFPIAAGSSSCLTYTVAVYTVLSSWWWTERPSETCSAFYKN